MPDDLADADLFEPVYSPKRVRFWLLHWGELEALTESPRSARDVADRLKREWIRLQGERRDCLCRELDAEPPAAVSASAGGYQARSTSASDIKADLERSAHILPIPWDATRKVYATMGRLDIWRHRSGWFIGERARPQDREPEPPGAPFLCADCMARELGWRPRMLTAAHNNA